MRVVDADQQEERCPTGHGIEELMHLGHGGAAVGKEAGLAGFEYKLLQLTL
jgi:hypothetical protein